MISLFNVSMRRLFQKMARSSVRCTKCPQSAAADDVSDVSPAAGAGRGRMPRWMAVATKGGKAKKEDFFVG